MMYFFGLFGDIFSACGVVLGGIIVCILALAIIACCIVAGAIILLLSAGIIYGISLWSCRGLVHFVEIDSIWFRWIKKMHPEIVHPIQIHRPKKKDNT